MRKIDLASPSKTFALASVGLSLALLGGCDPAPPAATTESGTDTEGDTESGTESDTESGTDPTTTGMVTEETVDTSGGMGCNACAPEATCMADTCVCNDGYEGDGTTCTDVDECADSPCDANATCTNTPGSFECACNKGFIGDGTTCDPAESCADDPCDENAECIDDKFDYECICNEGWEGDGFECNDVDECDDDPCDQNATCTNNDGGFECACDEGWDGDGESCSDIDECTGMPCDPNATCMNEEGSFDCTCNTDFAGDGFTCNGTLEYFDTCDGMLPEACASGLCITAPYDHCSEFCNQAIPDDCPNVGAAGFCVPIGMGDFACVGDLDTGLDGEAEILSPGDSATRNIGTLTDVDLYHLDLGVGIFPVLVTPDPDDDIQVEIYDTIGQPVSINNTGGAGAIEGTNLDSGAPIVVFAVVRNVGVSTGSYTIELLPAM